MVDTIKLLKDVMSEKWKRDNNIGKGLHNDFVYIDVNYEWYAIIYQGKSVMFIPSEFSYLDESCFYSKFSYKEEMFKHNDIAWSYSYTINKDKEEYLVYEKEDEKVYFNRDVFKYFKNILDCKICGDNPKGLFHIYKNHELIGSVLPTTNIKEDK